MLRPSLLATLVAALLPATSLATVHNGVFQADEAQATTCNVGSTTQAPGIVTYDDVTGEFTWSYTYGDNAPDYDNGALFDGGNETVAHFHGPAAPGDTAAAVVTTGPANPSNGSTVITSQQGTDLLGGLWYLNVHSSSCGAGEIRGQVSFPPAAPSLSYPGAAALAVSMLGVVLLVRRLRTATAPS